MTHTNKQQTGETTMNKYHGLVKTFLATMENNGDIQVGYYSTDEKSAPSRSCVDSVTKEDVSRDGNSPLWLGFIYNHSSVHYKALWIDIRTGEMDINGVQIGKIDREIKGLLIPVYNKHYLDKWAWMYKNDMVPDTYIGVHDEFNQIVFDERIEDGSVCLRNKETGFRTIDCNV